MSYSNSALYKAVQAQSTLKATIEHYAAIEAAGGMLPLPDERAVARLHAAIASSEWAPGPYDDGIPRR